MITLCAGLVLLGLLAWAFSGGGGKGSKEGLPGVRRRPAAAYSGTPTPGADTSPGASLPGCVTVASSARVGTYQVQARDVSVASPVRTFKLGH